MIGAFVLLAVSPFAFYVTVVTVLNAQQLHQAAEVVAYVLGIGYLALMGVLTYSAVTNLTAAQPSSYGAFANTAHPGFARGERAAKLARGGILATAFAAPGSSVVYGIGLSVGDPLRFNTPMLFCLAISIVLVVGGAIACAVGVLATFVHLRRLAVRVPDLPLAQATQRTFRAWIVTIIGGPCSMLMPGVINAASAASTPVFFVLAAGAFAIALLVLVAITGVLAVRYWIRFHDLAIATRRPPAK